MPTSASKQAQHIAKRNLPNFDENTVISFLIEILRLLNAPTTPLYRPNVVHVDFSVEQALQTPKRNLSNFGKFSVFSMRIEILRRLSALSTPFYTPKVVNVDFSVETIPAKRKTQSFKFRRKLGYFVPD
jgi:hypothetical protein